MSDNVFGNPLEQALRGLGLGAVAGGMLGQQVAGDRLQAQMAKHAAQQDFMRGLADADSARPDCFRDQLRRRTWTGLRWVDDRECLLAARDASIRAEVELAERTRVAGAQDRKLLIVAGPVEPLLCDPVPKGWFELVWSLWRLSWALVRLAWAAGRHG